MPTRQGSFHLFRFAGIDVFMHWSWFLVAAYEISTRSALYTSPLWNALEYVALFMIVLLHEFGHSLACKQVGGVANQIVLWPLGGIAYVSPPLRPGATLWSIAAGPLVNVVLLPFTVLLWWLSKHLGWWQTMPNAHAFILALCYMNFGLLFFNLLPIYPLDGGQILRSLLWFPLGRARSLLVVSGIGFVGVAGLFALAFYAGSIWYVIMAVFILMSCMGGLLQARTLGRAAAAPRHTGFACPDCQAVPPQGDFWFCPNCKKNFDTFLTQAACPNCGAQFAVTSCLDCGKAHPIEEWSLPPQVTPSPIVPPPLPPRQ